MSVVAKDSDDSRDSLVRFEGGFGVDPVAGVSGTGTIDANGNNVFPDVVRNDFVRGTRRVPPGGRPWVISRLTADIRTDGHISVNGRGLLLAGGPSLSTNGSQSVRPLLFCGDASFTTANAVALEANGDFRIDAFLTPPATGAV